MFENMFDIFPPILNVVDDCLSTSVCSAALIFLLLSDSINCFLSPTNSTGKDINLSDAPLYLRLPLIIVISF